MVTVSSRSPLPEAVHWAPADGAQVHAMNVVPGGAVSANVAPATLSGPALVTVMKYATVAPGVADATWASFATPRSAVPVASSVADAALALVTPCDE